MNIVGEYNVQYNIYTMFDVFSVKLKNHNLITKKGYEFFMGKWYQDEDYSIKTGYLHENKFYAEKDDDGNYDVDLSEYDDSSYSTSTKYIDVESYKAFKYNGEDFVDFNEKLTKICLGKCDYIDDELSKPSENDVKLYDYESVEYDITDFLLNPTELVMKCDLENSDLNGTTEIGVKTNHGRLVSHDIHPPYNLPFGSNMTLEYIFKLE